MAYDSKEKQKINSDSWYQRNKQRHKENVAANKVRYKREWIEYKASLLCSHCGSSHPAIIDFHHVVRDEGKRSVNELIADGRFAAARKEVEKCIPLCANCHRIVHWDEHYRGPTSSPSDESPDPASRPLPQVLPAQSSTS